MALKQLTRNAVERYFRTVLLVDERWQLAEDRVGKVTTPGLAARSRTTPVTDTVLQQPAGGDVDVVAMTNAFIKHGMHLAPVRPEAKPETRFAMPIRRVAHGSDVVVLDWNIYDDDGRRCVHLAKELFAEDGGGKLRVLVIYTGQQPDKVEATLKESLRVPEFEAGRSSRDNFHVMVLVKPESTTVTDDSRTASAGDLPERILEFVSESMYGILPTVALNALAAIRDSSQKLLAAFDANLDPGYLGHRALLRNPEEAADQLPVIVADELRAILEDPQVAQPGRVEPVCSWIDSPPDGLGPVDDPDLLKRLHRFGNPYEWPPDAWPGGERPGPRQIYDSQPALAPLHAPGLNPNDADERWSLRMSVSSSYGFDPPYLHLGSILFERLDADGVYWLCLMPLCDSVRLEAPTVFPLLMLEDRTAADNRRFNCVVRHDGEWIRLRVPARVDKVEMVEFGVGDGLVAAGGGRFASTGKRQFEWVATLKPDVAHRFAQSVGERISRIGLDESDWLRRWARG
ncbi:MAG TPA: response regulator receiver domain [Acidimicrobiia bacterium]|nr:response regulator receiver domain [Acidimicrobiia bacterium]